MKRTMVWMLAVLLVAVVASPAAAGPLQADLFSVAGPTNCGRITVVGNLITVDLKLTGGCTPINPPATANTHALCRSDFAGVLWFEGNLVDKIPPALGRIVGAEGLLRGALASGDDAAHFVVKDSDGDCTGSDNYISGFVK